MLDETRPAEQRRGATPRRGSRRSRARRGAAERQLRGGSRRRVAARRAGAARRDARRTISGGAPTPRRASRRRGGLVAAEAGDDDAELAAASAELTAARRDALSDQQRFRRDRRATAAAADALVRELEERGLGEEDSELLEARAAAAAARDRTPAVYHRRRVERLLAEGMEAKEKYDSLVARGVRGAAAERAFGVMCRALRRTEKGRRRLAACMDAAAARASPRQLESEFRTLLETCKDKVRPVFEQTTLPVYLGLAGDAWWEEEVRRVAVRPSWRYRLFFEEDEDLEPTDRRPVPLRGTRLASTVHKSIAGRLEHALHAWAARHWPDRVLHFAIAAGGSFADVAAHAVYMAVPDAPADVVVHVRSSVVAPRRRTRTRPTRPLTDFSDDVPPPLEATATPGDRREAGAEHGAAPGGRGS